MNSNHSDFAACSESSHGPAGSAEGRPCEDLLAASHRERSSSAARRAQPASRIFCMSPWPTCSARCRSSNALQSDELNKAFENSDEHERPAASANMCEAFKSSEERLGAVPWRWRPCLARR